MKLRSAMLAVALLGWASGCAGNDGAIELDAAGSALTDQGNDALFTLEVVEAPEEGFALEGVKVRVTPEGKNAIDVTRTIDDRDANAKLSKGDRLSCQEPAQNALGKDLAGKEMEVELFARADGTEERVEDATYDAE